MKRPNLEYFIEGLSERNTVVLAKAITLVESKKPLDKILSDRLLRKLTKSDNASIRIGITGTPGVGKSSFIEVFGNYLIEKGNRVAVLAVDPTSQRTGGSIMGDKTRMETLSRNPMAYIRPSASGNTLGGVNNKTREAILLCEAAEFDIVIVETVGVGQSETLVHGMVDFFLLMIQPGSGDDLQGIKKGIMEMADGIVINKADGEQEKLAERSKVDLLNALHMFAPEETGWCTQVQLCSALLKTGLSDVWKMICDYKKHMTKIDQFDSKRENQDLDWFDSRVNYEVLNLLIGHKKVSGLKNQLEQKIQTQDMSVTSASDELLRAVTQLINSLD